MWIMFGDDEDGNDDDDDAIIDEVDNDSDLCNELGDDGWLDSLVEVRHDDLSNKTTMVMTLVIYVTIMIMTIMMTMVMIIDYIMMITSV